MAGDGALFTCQDAVEAAWAVVQPILNTHPKALAYKRGSWGPKEAEAIDRTGRLLAQPLLGTGLRTAGQPSNLHYEPSIHFAFLSSAFCTLPMALRGN